MLLPQEITFEKLGDVCALGACLAKNCPSLGECELALQPAYVRSVCAFANIAHPGKEKAKRRRYTEAAVLMFELCNREAVSLSN